MASTIVTKNSSTASAVPLTGDLTQGELAVNVTDKKLYTKDSGGTVVKIVGGLGNQEANAVAITGGSINGTTVGATTASTGAFTTLSASSTVSGTGFSTYLASPPAIGGTAAAAGSFTTLSASGNTTLSGGTANGVAYLNGSKVVTTGSALTFDGTNLGIGVTSPSAPLEVQSNSGGTGIRIRGRATANTGTLRFYANDGTTQQAKIEVSDNTFEVGSITNVPFVFNQNGSEQMRLTSTGLGIGTSSPATRLSVDNTRSDTAGTGWFTYTNAAVTSGKRGMRVDTNNVYWFDYYNGSSWSAQMGLDSSGNLGLGVTPSAWISSGKAIDIAGFGSVAQTSSGSLASTFNAYQNSAGNWIYKTTNAAAQYQCGLAGLGQHAWYTAASGTAGNAITFTQAMTLDASGNLQLGRTSVIGTNNRLAIQMSGTSASSYTAASNAAFAIDAGTATNSVINLVGGGDMGIFHSNSSNAYDVGISFGDNSNRILSFTTANAERARIDSSGRLLLGTTSATIGAVTCAVALDATTVNSGFGMGINGNASNTQVMRFAYAGTAVGSISITSSTTAYNTSSDYRLKDNQQPLTGSGAFIDALKPKTWEWKADGSKGVGFIAHEVQEVSPGSVIGAKDAVDEEGNPIMQAMEYGSAEFIANIVAELQSLRQRVAQLEGK